MVIGIDASRAFLRSRTGIEEYAYQVISHLREPLCDERVVLYVRTGQNPDFELPAPWQVKALWAPRFWTHIRLSIEMLLHRPDILFVPAHTVPIIHPQSIVTVHGLEYEFSPESYSWWERFYMGSVIRFSCHVAETVIAVSENTKRDLVHLYGAPEEKIRVVYEGKPEGQGTVNSEQKTGNRKQGKLATYNSQLTTTRGFPLAPRSRPHRYTKRYGRTRRLDSSLPEGTPLGQAGEQDGKIPYLLFIGRIEERKNVKRIVEAFDILKKRNGIPHQLVLAGKPGYGRGAVKRVIEQSEYQDDIVEMGYVNEASKAALLAGADVFVFPSLYEGFGLPVVEAQAVGVLVVTSNTSSLPEIGGDGALYADPLSAESIADCMWRALSDQVLRGGILEKGRINADRFDWRRCAKEIADILRK
jgi:glycosyltransferase involved in cell wall biosynthesis